MIQLSGKTGKRLGTPSGQLSPREFTVLLLVAEGLSNKEIALRLCVAVGTVRNHVSHILDKLEVGSRVEAALLAHHRGYLLKEFRAS